MSNPVPEMIEQWNAARAELRKIEEAEHPDLVDTFGRTWTWKDGNLQVDTFGRTWTWKDGNLYTHDGLLAQTADMIPMITQLPAEGLADRNPNYAGLCDICQRKDQS